MVSSCCAVNCSNRWTRDCSIKFFRIPIVNTTKRQKWIHAINRLQPNTNNLWIPSNFARICSKHFISGKPSNDPNNPDYVPSIFNHSKDEGNKKLGRGEWATKRKAIFLEDKNLVDENGHTQELSKDPLTQDCVGKHLLGMNIHKLDGDLETEDTCSFVKSESCMETDFEFVDINIQNQYSSSDIKMEQDIDVVCPNEVNSCNQSQMEGITNIKQEQLLDEEKVSTDPKAADFKLQRSVGSADFKLERSFGNLGGSSFLQLRENLVFSHQPIIEMPKEKRPRITETSRTDVPVFYVAGTTPKGNMLIVSNQHPITPVRNIKTIEASSKYINPVTLLQPDKESEGGDVKSPFLESKNSIINTTINKNPLIKNIFEAKKDNLGSAMDNDIDIAEVKGVTEIEEVYQQEVDLEKTKVKFAEENLHLIEPIRRESRTKIFWRRIQTQFNMSSKTAFIKNKAELADTSTLSPMKLFLLFFNEEVLEWIVDYVKLNCRNNQNCIKTEKDNSCKCLATKELLLYIGITIYMSLKPQKIFKQYWEKSLWGDQVIPKIMGRDQFNKIEDSLKFWSERNKTEYNQMQLHKLTDLLTILQGNFRKFYYPSQDLSINKKLIGRKVKIALKTKTILNINIYSLCELTTGYYLTFEMYPGKDSYVGSKLADSLPKATTTEKIGCSLIEPYFGNNHVIYINDFNSTPTLALFLKGKCATDVVAACRNQSVEKLLPSRFHTLVPLPGESIDFVGNAFGASLLIQKFSKKNNKIIHVLSTRHDNKNIYYGDCFGPESYNELNTKMKCNKIHRNDEDYLVERNVRDNWSVKMLMIFINFAIHNAKVHYMRQNKLISTTEFRQKIVEELFVDYETK